MSFKGFSIFSSGGHFVQWSETILAILGSLKEYFHDIILKSGHWSRRRCRLKEIVDGQTTDKYRSQ